ncbi:Mg2 transporter protein CorA family protein [Gemmatirosa kalamazoonensis]|uniref:Mg2 transporter protein CorA family protein n=1 Tax=Gemmatirosa kalamazoonensis TaxID=861299 RepID=W0RLP7_9BACT|nr:Mg2 transporter protein CorA family protein [Gemmatirosa kalamazoonensis]
MATRAGDVTPSGGAPADAATSVSSTGSNKATPAWTPCSFYRAGDGTVQRDLPPKALAAALADTAGTLWVDVDATNRHQHALLEKIFKFHPLAVEDTLNPNSRVKYEEYDGFLFVIARAVKLEEDTPDPYDVETQNLYFFLGQNFLVSVHSYASDSVRTMLERVALSDDLLARGAARIMHGILDVSVDAYFPLLDGLDELLDKLEERVFVQFDQGALRDIFGVKRLVLTLRRHLAPQREVLNQLTNRPSALLPQSVQVYFRDVYDHVLRINDTLDTYRELLSSTLDSYLSQVSNRLSRSSKGLTVVATVTLPFVIMSGMWGMNFAHIPLMSQPHGFALLVVLQIVVAAVLLVLLRWLRLL